MSDCHTVTEILPGLFIGGLRDLQQILEMEPDVLVPLDSLSGYIWELGFRGEILYYPIQDMKILPLDVTDRLVRDVLARLDAGKRAAVFCVGGHGRTGYAAACILAARGNKDPISWLREHYCAFAVENARQEEGIREYMEFLKKAEHL